MNAIAKKARFALAALSLLGGATAFGQTLTATDITPSAGAAGQVVTFNYTGGANVSVVITNIGLTDANAIITGNAFQQFDANTSTFVNCDGTSRNAQFAAAGGVPAIEITCTTGGRYTVRTGSPTTQALPNFTNFMRATFGIAGGATGGQTATFTYGANCAAGQFPNVVNCTEFTNTGSTRVTGDVSDTGTVTIATGPTLTPPGTTTLNLGGGTIGQQVTGNIQYSSAGGNAGQSSTLTCTPVAPVSVVSGSPQTITTGGAQPAPVVVGITLTGSAQSGTVNCNGTVFTVNASAGTPATGPTLTPPGTTTIALGSTLIGNASNTSIVFTAAGGNAGQSTPLTCTATAPVVISSGGTQTVATGSQPAPIVAGIVLTGAAQTGTLTCNGTVFTLNAPGGVLFVPPSIIPATSFWSQLSLIALFAALGGLFVAFRRNA